MRYRVHANVCVVRWEKGDEAAIKRKEVEGAKGSVFDEDLFEQP